jgi:hypothetical protein
MNDLKGNQQDDFQFKPLTKGLGFHPKKDSAASGTPTSPAPIATKTVPAGAAQTYDPTPASAGRSLRLDTPLPRPETRRTPTPSTANQTVDNILKNLSDKNRSLNFQDKGQNLSPYLQTAPSLAAGFLDFLLITALGLLYLMTLIFTLKLDLIKSVTDGGTEVWISTGAVFLVVGFVYYVTQRMFVGFTLGEWAYEQRLGLPEEMTKATYGLKVFYRQLLIIVTGIVTIPLLSWAVGRDLGGISGLCTYRKR